MWNIKKSNSVVESTMVVTRPQVMGKGEMFVKCYKVKLDRRNKFKRSNALNSDYS
jgi:hypothetical protein